MFISVQHSNDASVDFHTDAILSSPGTPCPRECVNGVFVPVESREARFILLSVDRLMRCYSGATHAKAPVYRLVLMDGSETCICAFLTVSSSILLDKKISGGNKELPVGSTIISKEHTFLSFRCGNGDVERGCLVISDMAWRMPPNHNVPSKFRKTDNMHFGRGSWTQSLLEDQKTVHIETSVLDLCQQRLCVVHTKPRRAANNNSVDYLLTSAEANDIPHSIVDEGNRIAWSLLRQKASRRPLSAVLVLPDRCSCAISFGTQVCLCKTFPINQIDKEEVYYTMKDLGLIKSRWNDFDQMPTEEKCWCMRWWYSVNYTQNCDVGIPLPKCVRDSITELCTDCVSDQPKN